ncbi:hypothetical protein RF55_23145 [Lasius niger]|uniref:Uncharacterized protein n=1 Tax=Lasius niger TaxID=67767 RepID=A0A0J7JWV3_LASNI|nr:hypothetical protein RF55_23145 [Lasius niger]
MKLVTAMEKKDSQNSRFGDLYRMFMLDYENLQHMEVVHEPSERTERNTCYLLHHGVLKESSTTTKLRVVFNSSQRTRSGESLNAQFLIGANLLPEL